MNVASIGVWPATGLIALTRTFQTRQFDRHRAGRRDNTIATTSIHTIAHRCFRRIADPFHQVLGK